MLIGILLAIILVLLIFYTIAELVRRRNIQKLNQQLEEIIHNFGTNELLRVTYQNPLMNGFVNHINQLITLYKQDQQRSQKKTLELKQEITNISHDLRTPLTSIKGFSELLQENTLSVKERQEYGEIVEKKITVLAEIIDRFYEVAKIESEDLILNIDSLSLENLVADTILPFYNDFKKRKIQIHIDQDNLQSLIQADEHYTKRILTNVLQNSFRYAYTFFKLEVVKEGDYLILIATNDTDHFCEEDISKIFERTYSLDKSRTKGQNGLGLYIVKQLMEIQEGKVTVSFEQNCFTLSLYFLNNAR